MNETTKAIAKRLLTIASLILALACCMLIYTHPATAYALQEPEYTPGENYYIDSPEAFESQDVGHDRADEISASTQYYVTSAFYLNWISPDQVIHEGEDAYIGCEATGLEDIRYEWRLSKDGGATWEAEALIGNEHTVSDLAVNEPETEPYLYRCTITNGDGTSTLTADVRITVLEAPTGSGVGKTISQTGDERIGIAALVGAAACASLALILATMRPKPQGEEEAA